MSSVDWPALAQLANILKDPGAGPSDVSDVEWRRIAQAMAVLRQQHDWAGLVRLRVLFTDICARDTFTGSESVRQLEAEAIRAAELLNDKLHMAIFWGDRGHNLHRQGFHQESIDAFNTSSRHYQHFGNDTHVLHNRHMTALCYRALDNWERAHTIMVEILDQLPADDPWRGQPLQVLAWLYRDQGNWKKAEDRLREALQWQAQSENSDILVAGTLADLGELLGLQERFDEAQTAFARSLAILAKHKGQYHRQEARTKLKLAEMFSRNREYQLALKLLREADELCCIYGHYYDQLWKIEMAVASVLLRTGDYRAARGKFMSAFTLRRGLNLSTWLLMKQIVVRYAIVLTSRFTSSWLEPHWIAGLGARMARHDRSRPAP